MKTKDLNTPVRNGAEMSEKKLVASLKTQVKLLELECQVLKSGESVVNSSRSAIGIEDSRARLRALEVEHDNELCRRDAEKAALEEELSKVQTEAMEMKHELRFMEGRGEKALQSYKCKMEEEYRHLCEQIAEDARMKCDLAKLSQDFEQARRKYEEEGVKWSQERSDLKFANAKLKEQVARLESEMDCLQRSNGYDRVRFEELQMLASDVEKVTNASREKADVAESRCEELRIELAHARSRMLRAEKFSKEVEEENGKLVESNAVLGEQLRQARQKLSQYASEQSQALKDRETAVTGAATQQVRMESMQRRVEEIESVYQVEVNEHQKARSDMAAAQAQAQDFSQRCGVLEEKLNLAQVMLVERERREAAALTEAASCRSRLEHVTLELEKCRSSELAAKQSQNYSERRRAQAEQELQMRNDLKTLNLGELSSVMHSNMQLAQQFDNFLRKYDIQQQDILEEEQNRRC